MRLRARLVVLSACETGRGQPRADEGVLALDRAFLVAGAGAVISSLWVVSDEATEALMKSLYSELARGRPADVALANAMALVARAALVGAALLGRFPRCRCRSSLMASE